MKSMSKISWEAGYRPRHTFNRNLNGTKRGGGKSNQKNVEATIPTDRMSLEMPIIIKDLTLKLEMNETEVIELALKNLHKKVNNALKELRTKVRES